MIRSFYLWPSAPRSRSCIASSKSNAESHAFRHPLTRPSQVAFGTPPELADRMVALADIRPGQQVLEPSAGTGRVIDAIRRNAHGYTITAVELNCNMFHRVPMVDCVDDSRQADFLECNGDLGTFDRIVMNPPFANADDIKHIMHALKMRKPGGRLVAICANGPRQNDKLRPIVEARGGIWEELPSDTFISTGTSVRTVLLTLDA